MVEYIGNAYTAEIEPFYGSGGGIWVVLPPQSNPGCQPVLW